jgi:hypothetical protein
LPREGRNGRSIFVTMCRPDELCSIKSNEPGDPHRNANERNDFSQIVVTRATGSSNRLTNCVSPYQLVQSHDVKREAVEMIIQQGFPFPGRLDASRSPRSMMTMPKNPAVLVRDCKAETKFIVTRFDVNRVL